MNSGRCVLWTFPRRGLNSHLLPFTQAWANSAAHDAGVYHPHGLPIHAPVEVPHLLCQFQRARLPRQPRCYSGFRAYTILYVK